MNKKMLGLLTGVLMVFGVAGSASSAIYQFEDLIDNWVVNGTTYDSVYIDEDYDIANSLLQPNAVAAPFSYTHDINDDVNLAAGDEVIEATLEIDFTDMDLLENGDSVGSFFCVTWDQSENVQYTYDTGTSAWIEISDNNDVQTTIVNIDWLNDDGLLDVTINVSNSLGTGDIGIDHSKLYGTAQTVPVPSAFFLLASGLLGLVGVSRKKTA